MTQLFRRETGDWSTHPHRLARKAENEGQKAEHRDTRW